MAILGDQDVMFQARDRSVVFKFFPSVVGLGGIGEDFDEHYRVEQNIACIRFKLRLAADDREVWVGVQPSPFDPKFQVARVDSTGLLLELLPQKGTCVKNDQVVIG